MPVRNQHPAQLTVMHLDPTSAAALPSGEVAARVDLAYSSMFLRGQKPGDPLTQFAMDGELLRTAVAAQVGLGADLTLSVEVPMIGTTGGFLDNFLIGYHDLFGFPDQGRDVYPKNQFGVFADYQGQTVFAQRENAFALADVPVSLAWQVLQPKRDTIGFALRAGLELPTGDTEDGFGNGKIDTAFGAVAEWPLAWGTWYGSVQHTFAGNPDRAADAQFSFADVTSAGLGLELPLYQDLSLLVQTEWESSTLRDLGFDYVSSSQWLLWTGGRLRLDRDLCVEVTMAEDLAGFVSPDVTFWLAMAWLPGRKV